ncbi:LysR family transcriptional regulator [Bradyrhizobium tropiciagri]|uniref:LysR family transcriptional regulator n=1 Tax=Bradyrhizobium tropiciagri TaxID=312253 RepID=UPI00067BB807|nr:LysR family transcriptional regulator [Bradyrhizobium tropiciagri]
MESLRFDLRLLLELEAIHRFGSLTAAGDALGLSQPALSHALARMRTAFGDDLFVRTSRGLLPTPRADELATQARKIIAFVRSELVSAPFEPASLERTFKLGMSDVAQMVFLPKLVSCVRKIAPGSRFQVMSLESREMAEALEAGLVDLAIGRFPKLKGASLKREELFRRGYLCLVSARHPRIRGQKVTMDQYQQLPHMIVSSPGRADEIFDRLLRSRGVKRNVVLEVPHALCIPGIISGSDLIVTVPHSVALSLASHAGIRLVKPPIDTTPFGVSQHWSSRYENDPANNWLRTIVSGLFREGIPTA